MGLHLGGGGGSGGPALAFDHFDSAIHAHAAMPANTYETLFSDTLAGPGLFRVFCIAEFLPSVLTDEITLQLVYGAAGPYGAAYGGLGTSGDAWVLSQPNTMPANALTPDGWYPIVGWVDIPVQSPDSLAVELQLGAADSTGNAASSAFQYRNVRFAAR